MAKNKISEWSSLASNNTDVGGIDIAEGCAPSGINNAIREVMAQVKDMQAGLDGDSLTLSGNLILTGGLTLDGNSGTTGQVITSAGGSNTPTWVTPDAFVNGMILMWGGSAGAIPSGWRLCDGTLGTPDLRNRFIIGSGSSYPIGSVGGSANAIVVSHTHTALSAVTDLGHSHSYQQFDSPTGTIVREEGSSFDMREDTVQTSTQTTGISVNTTISSTGSSGTNANLPPYYALAYIIKI